MNPNKSNILAIETATSSCSVALTYDDRVFARNQTGNNIHSNVLLDMVNDVLAEAKIASKQLQAVAVGQGPGSFTGLRIGIGVAQGIAYGVNVPMIGVSSLDALANQAPGTGRVIAGIDARMGEIYWCEYLKTSDSIERIGELKVGSPNSIVSEGLSSKITLVGNAWQEYQGKFNEQLLQNSTIIDSEFYPMAESILSLAHRHGELIDAIDFSPEYVRNDVAKKSSKNKFR